MVTIKIKRKNRIVLYVTKKTMKEIGEELEYFENNVAVKDVTYYLEINR